MLQIVICLIVILIFLSILELIRSCLLKKENDSGSCVGPFEKLKNKIKGINKLKEEKTSAGAQQNKTSDGSEQNKKATEDTETV